MLSAKEFKVYSYLHTYVRSKEAHKISRILFKTNFLIVTILVFEFGLSQFSQTHAAVIWTVFFLAM